MKADVKPNAGTSSPAAEAPAASAAKAEASAVTVAWLLAGAVALLVLLVALGALAAAIQGPEVDALDRFVSPWVHGLASPPLDAVMHAATFVGTGTVLVPVGLAIVAWLMYRRRLRAALFVALTAFGSVVVNDGIKILVHRPRPRLPWSTVLPDYSFPSGHSMNSLALFLSIAVVIWAFRGRRAGAVSVLVAIALSLVIGASRIYLGVHYFTDVIGGYIAAVLWVLVVATALGAGEHVRAWRRNGRRSDVTRAVEEEVGGPAS